MAYTAGGKIQATDYNGFNTSLNSIWSTGSSSSGYGQTAISAVSTGQKVTTTNWNNLLTKITTAANHQGSSGSLTNITAPTSGTKISAFTPALSDNIAVITNNKLNAATQGTTTSYVATSTSTWSDYVQFTFTVVFASDDAARYFFNAGGQFGFAASHPAGSGTSINQLINSLCSEFGTVWFSSPSSGSVSLSSITYNGVTKVGGGNPSGTSINANNGFYSVYPSGSNTLITQYSDYSYHSFSNTYLRLSANYDGAGRFTFTVIIDEVPNSVSVSSGTQCGIIVRPPSTSYLTNTWGAFAVNTAVSYADSCPIPVAGTLSPSSATAGVYYSGTFTVNNATSLSSAILLGATGGLTASIVGTTVSVTGTPTASGSFAVRVTATNACGTAQPSTDTVTSSPATILNYCPTPTANSTPGPATIGYPYSGTFAVANATSLSGASISGTGAAGLSVSISGTNVLITGTATTVGTWTVSVTATNACGYGTTKVTTVTSSPVNSQLSCTVPSAGTISPIVAQTGVAYSGTFHVNDATSLSSASLSGTGASGLTANISGTNVLITGTPTTSGTFTVTVTATNACGTGTTRTKVVTSGTVYTRKIVNLAVSVVAGGGGGGGRVSGTTGGGGGGGGAGVKLTGYSLPSSYSLAVVVGAGGAAAAPSGTGGTGGTSSVIGTNFTMVANGGLGGTLSVAGNGGAPGTVSVTGATPTSYTGSNGTNGSTGAVGAGGQSGGNLISDAVQVNCGDGGPGGASNGVVGYAGAVLIYYPGSSALATGGTITVSGGYVYHVFHSNGTFTVNA